MTNRLYRGIKVSVVMSCLNTPKEYLTMAIESILNQTYNELEFIIVNNGGNNYDDLVEFQKKDSRIKVINNAITMELPEALNLAIKQATGKYVARMDSDDFAMPKRIEKQVCFMEKNANVFVCGTYARIFDSQHKFAIYPWNKENEIAATLFFSNEIYHPTVMFRKKFLDDYNVAYKAGYNYSEDFEMWNRCARLGAVAIVPYIGLMYRVHLSNTSSTGKEKQIESKKKVLKSNLNLLELEEKDFEYMMEISGIKDVNDINELIFFVKRVLKNNRKLMKYSERDLKKVLSYSVLRIILKSKCSVRWIKKSNLLYIMCNSHFLEYYVKKIYYCMILKCEFEHSFNKFAESLKHKLV